MVTTIFLVNIHHQAQLQFFFLPMSSFQPYSQQLANIQCRIVNSITVLYVPSVTSPGHLRLRTASPNPHFTAQIYFHSNPTPFSELLMTVGAAVCLCVLGNGTGS